MEYIFCSNRQIGALGFKDRTTTDMSIDCRTAIPFLLLACLLAAPVMAQRQRQGPEQRAAILAEQLEETMQLLQLDENQIAAVRSVLDAGNDEMLALIREFINAAGERQRGRPRTERMRAVGDSTKARLTPLLSEAQMERYEAILADRRRWRRRN